MAEMHHDECNLDTDEEERMFHKSVMHFMNSLRLAEQGSKCDLLHFVNVCTDMSNVVTRQFHGKGLFLFTFCIDFIGLNRFFCYCYVATNEYAIEVLTAMLDHFDGKLACHGPHAKLLREVSIRVKVLKKIRDFLEQIFGTESDDHDHVDSYKLAKIRMDVAKWETKISDRYLILKAMREPVEKLGDLFKEVDKYKDNIKNIVLELSIILDNFKIPSGW